MEEARLAQVYGVRPSRTFERAAAKFVLENQHKRSIGDDVRLLKGLMPWIGSIPIDKVHMGALQPWMAERRRLGRSNGTINNGLQVVRRILNLAAGEWILFLDADDLIERNYLEERFELLKQHPHADLLVGCWEEFRDDPETRFFRCPTAAGQTTKLLEQSAIAFAPWALHAALVRRARLTPELRWPEELDGHPSEDTAFWFPVIFGASVAWSSRAGALYRVQTASSRNEIRDAEEWIRAVTEVIQHNVAFLKARGGSPDAEQCANIVRVFESTYRIALKQGAREAASLALARGKHWLGKYPPKSWAMGARKIFGLRLFNLARHGTI